MATAFESRKYVWNISDQYTVCVYNVCPQNIDSNVVLECYETSRENVDFKSAKKSQVLYVQFPVPSRQLTYSSDILRENFVIMLQKFVNSNKDKIQVAVSIDSSKSWSREEFCEILLSGFLDYARSGIGRQGGKVTLAFCGTEHRSFEKACEACKIFEEKTAKQSQHNFESGRRSKMYGSLPVSITVEKGSLDTTKADALACTMSSDLDLRQGTVTKALLDKSGKELQKNLYRKCPDQNLDFGRIIPVCAPNLDCRRVLFGVMLPFNKKYTTFEPEDYYRATVHEFVKACLKCADKEGFRSLAFPAVGTGILHFPVGIVADEMFDTVINWSKDSHVAYLKDVRFVIYPTDLDALKAFQEAEKRYGTIKREYPDARQASQSYKSNKCSIPRGYTAELVQLYCQDTIDNLRKCDCEVDIKGDEIIIKGPEDVLAIAGTKMKDALTEVEKAFPVKDFIDLSQSNFSQRDYKGYLDEIKSTFKVDCFVDTVKKKVAVFGKDLTELSKAKDKIKQFFFPDRKRNETDHFRDVQKNTSGGGSGNVKRQSKSFQNSSQVKLPVEALFEIKGKVKVKVYSADILSVPVDCIVNAANVSLTHEGGIAKEIASRAGKALNKEGCEFLKSHGKLKVGEACSTGAGKLKYKCIVHTVGPCWKDYKPYTLRDVERCETDLYYAVLNSLIEAEKRNMQTIAVSSISSGMFGCPLVFCSVQYAKAVVGYSNLARNPLKEIHFVDTNLKMVEIMQKTFHSMIPDEKVPKSYNKLDYVKSLGREASEHAKKFFKETNVNGSWKDSQKEQKKSGQLSPRNRGSELIVYPYSYLDDHYLDDHKRQRLVCCFGPNQNLFIYSFDILSMTGIDIIVCGNIPSGNTQGRLANAILDRGNDTYEKEKEKAFKIKAPLGSVVSCSTGNWRFKWVAHAILFKKKDTKDKNDREDKVTNIFHNIFHTLKEKRCHSMALPLIGTGFGKADPVYYAHRCFDGLYEFCSFNKDYPFDIHLVNSEEEKTQTAIKTVEKAVRDATPLVRQPCKNKPVQKTATSQQSQYKPKEKTPTGQPRRPVQHSHHENSTLNKSYTPESRSTHGRYNNKRNEMHNNTKTRYKEYPVGDSYTLENNDHPVSTTRKGVNGSEIGDVTETQNMEQSRERDASGPDADEDEEFGNMADQNEPSYTKKPGGNLPIFNVGNSDHQLSNDEDEDKDTAEISDEENEESDPEEPETEVNEEIVDKEKEEHENEKEMCVICMDEITEPQALPCGHVFCKDCIEAHFNYKEVCPTCGKVCGKITGDQPEGSMDCIINESACCAGFEECGRIEITYQFPDGRQGANHPSPGTWYKGIKRKAYLPNNSRGKQINAMLRVAFDRKLVFTIGRSRTTGADGVITWNDIHHKTDPKPNSQFGYPDPTYLDRVTEELKIKGVTIDDIPALSGARKKRR